MNGAACVTRICDPGIARIIPGRSNTLPRWCSGPVSERSVLGAAPTGQVSGRSGGRPRRIPARPGPGRGP
jgi:hypothetical protein